ncbi:MAG: DMT family transporter [Patescibacteria group bacterium]|nr:DMT family transporter [Patescibacteria group bacterium]MDE2589021.1 DMT family transporter [Patescibacteria group bacterium]
MNKLFGTGIILMATTAYAVLFPLFKKGSEKIQPFTAMAISMFVLFFVSLVLSIIFENGLQLKFANVKVGILFLVLAGAINVIAFWLELIGLKIVPVGEYTMFSLLTPIIAGVAAFFLLGEPLQAKLFIGLTVMAVGLFIAIK